MQSKMAKTRAKLHRALVDAGFNHQHPDVQRLSAEFDRLHNEYLSCPLCQEENTEES